MWELELQGDEKLLEKLSNTIIQDSRTIVQKDNKFFLEIADIDKLEDPKEVKDLADLIIEGLNLSISLFSKQKKTIKLSMSKIDDITKSRITYLSASCSGTSSIYADLTVYNKDRNGNMIPIYNQKINPVLSAIKSEKVKEALILFDYDSSSWFTLYKIYEIIKKDVGVRKLKDKKWCTELIESSFTQSADHQKISGLLEARHYRTDDYNPDKIMSKSDANSFIRDIMLKWVEEMNNHSDF